MELFGWIGLCCVILLPVQLLRRKTPELALLLILGTLAVLAGRVVSYAAPLLEELRDLFGRAGVDRGYVDILLKTLAACCASRMGADLCRDGGSQALAGAVELAGAATVLVILLPLLREVAAMLLEIGNGGVMG